MYNKSLSVKFFFGHFDVLMVYSSDKKLLLKIAAKLKHLRNEKGVSQIEVYNETGIHMGRMETGKTNLSVSSLSTLCKYFKIKMKDFFAMVEE